MTTRHLTFIVGGARSGKSAHAERLADACGLPVTYIATARIGDAEFAERVAHHRARRPGHWRVVETPLDLGAALAAEAAPGRCVIVDCLTLWLSHLLWPVADEAWPDDGESSPGDAKAASPSESATRGEAAVARIDTFLDVCASAPGTVLVVSNEIGLGVVPMGAATRHFVDELGRLNQRMAALASEATLMVAGLPLALKAPRA